MISVPFSLPVKITQLRISVAFVPSSNLSDSSREWKDSGGPGMILRAAQRERIAFLALKSRAGNEYGSGPREEAERKRGLLNTRFDVKKREAVVAIATKKDIAIVDRVLDCRKLVACGWRFQENCFWSRPPSADIEWVVSMKSIQWSECVVRQFSSVPVSRQGGV